jgi:hypothetical protein
MHAQKTFFDALLSIFSLNPRRKRDIFIEDICWSECNSQINNWLQYFIYFFHREINFYNMEKFLSHIKPKLVERKKKQVICMTSSCGA